MNRILIVAAHPDDELLGCGGMIARYSEAGVRFKVLFIGEGSTCRHSDLLSSEALAAIAVRNAHAVAALGVLGVDDITFENVACGRFDQYPIIEITKMIEQSIVEFSPTAVFTHSTCDSNNDHRITHNATLIATRPMPGSDVLDVYTYEVPSSTEWRFLEVSTPNSFIALSQQHIEQKWRALSEYGSEMRAYPFPRSEQGIEVLARFRGMQVGTEFAEAFTLVRSIK